MTHKYKIIDNKKINLTEDEIATLNANDQEWENGAFDRSIKDLRQKRKESLVIDIVDSHVIFEKHFNKRRAFYKRQKFKIIQANMEQYKNDEWDTIYDPYLSKKLKSTKSSTTKKKKNIKIKTETYKNPKDALLTGVCLISDDD